MEGSTSVSDQVLIEGVRTVLDESEYAVDYDRVRYVPFRIFEEGGNLLLREHIYGQDRESGQVISKDLDAMISTPIIVNHLVGHKIDVENPEVESDPELGYKNLVRLGMGYATWNGAFVVDFQLPIYWPKGFYKDAGPIVRDGHLLIQSPDKVKEVRYILRGNNSGQYRDSTIRSLQLIERIDDTPKGKPQWERVVLDLDGNEDLRAALAKDYEAYGRREAEREGEFWKINK